MEKDTIQRMLRVTQNSHWHFVDYYMECYWNITETFIHVKRYNSKPLIKRKYGIRRKYFKPYESHRKRGVDYLPF